MDGAAEAEHRDDAVGGGDLAGRVERLEKRERELTRVLANIATVTSAELERLVSDN